MSLIVTRPNSSGSGTGTSPYTQADKLALEMEMAYSTAQRTYFKELTYDTTTGDLSNVSIYVDNTKIVKLFNKDLIYSTGLLSQVVLTRTSDSATLTKDLLYDGNDNLSSIEVSVT